MNPIKSLAGLAWSAARWKALRGGWFLNHLRHHRPFDPRALPAEGPIDVIVAVVDHYEPTGKRGHEAAVESVASWCEDYRRIAERHRDADGRVPQHTWFYRTEYANVDCVRVLGDAAFRGLGEVEFHLHHGFDTHETFAAKIRAGLDLGHRAGAMLTAEERPRPRFAYIAGNWSLDNGSGDPSKGGCNTELIALREAGCYADFTFPALGTHAQPRKTNAIYYATDDPGPKSYDTGRDVAVGGSPTGDLMIVQGPLLFDWTFGSFEAAALEDFAPPVPRRLEHWLRANVHVRGRPEWIFVKLHTHAMQSRATFLGPALDATLEAMGHAWNRPPFRLHHVTAREMYNIIKAAEAGSAGDPGLYRDFDVPRPANRHIRCDRPWLLRTFTPDRVALDILDPGPATIELADGPLRSVRGRLWGLEACFRDGRVEALRVRAEGNVRVEADLGSAMEPEVWAASVQNDV